MVLHISGGTSILKELSNEGMTVAVEDAIRLNASAITLSIFVGAEGERETLLNLAKVVDAGQKYGIPVLAVTAVGKEMSRDARYLGLACRIAAEIGAHMVKTYFCEGFEEIVRATPVPIVVAGGKKVAEKEALQMAYNAVRAGARGVDMGRNIFQSDSPVGMIRAVRAVVHRGAGVDEARRAGHLRRRPRLPPPRARPSEPARCLAAAGGPAAVLARRCHRPEHLGIRDAKLSARPAAASSAATASRA